MYGYTIYVKIAGSNAINRKGIALCLYGGLNHYLRLCDLVGRYLTIGDRLRLSDSKTVLCYQYRPSFRVAILLTKGD